MFGLMNKKKVIAIFAKELASLQKKADRWYYINKNQEMSSYVLEHVDEIKDIATKLNIVKDVYNEACKIYDFRNSGKKDYKPDLNSLKA